MKIKKTYDIITTEGTTSDIISVVMMAYEIEKDEQIASLANELRGDTELETCRNIWQYLITNIRYVADIGTQEIKSPARLVHDGVGDCKSYSVFTACILRYLGIKHFFRFASYSNTKEATHVYIVACINNKNIPIDAVAAVQAFRPFGEEIEFTYRVDMNNRTTKIAYLAGVGNYKIGATDFDVNAFLASGIFDVWLDGESESSLTQAKGYLLSEWHKEWVNYSVSRSTPDQIEILNRLQYIGAMIRAYNELKSSNESLYQLGNAVYFAIENKLFDSNELDPNNRNFFSDKQNNDLVELMNYDSLYTPASFLNFWNENIIEANEPYNLDGLSGIGSVDELQTNINKTGGYYLYTYIPDSDQTKYGAIVYRKRLVQKRIFDLNKEVLTTAKKMTSAEMDNLIYAGCVTTWGAKPQDAIVSLKSGVSGVKVGVLTEATILLITKIIIAVITVIVTIVKAVNALKAIDEDTVNGGAIKADDMYSGPNSENYNNGSKSGLIEAGTSWLLPLMLVGSSFLFKKKNKSKK